MANKWLSMLESLPGAVDLKKDIFAEGVRTPSPSVNFIFGNTHLVPFGSSVIFWGPPKGGKSLICSMMIGQLHKDYPDAIAVKYNTELRESFQMTPLQMRNLGIDTERYQSYDTNMPEEIFDKIEVDIAAACEKGAPIKLIIIDSITDILGRRTINATSVSKQQIGDEAATIATGLKRIKNVIRKYGITLLMVAQERAELDQLEQMRGRKTKMAGAFYLRHFAEYFVYLCPNEAKEGKSDFLGNDFKNEDLTDVMGNPEQTILKIKAQMKNSSVGISGRVGEFTFHKLKGIINTAEEAVRLGVARNILEMPNNRTYVLKNFPESGKEGKWTSKEDCLLNVQANSGLFSEIVKRVKLQDIERFKNGIEEEEPVGETPLEG